MHYCCVSVAFPFAERLEISAQLIKRSQSITSLTSYLAGCINKSLRAHESGGRAAPYSGGRSRGSIPCCASLSIPVRTGHAGSTALSVTSTADPPSPSSASLRSCSTSRNLADTPESAASHVSECCQSRPITFLWCRMLLQCRIGHWTPLKDSRNKGRFLSRVCRQLDTATCKRAAAADAGVDV
jgi:hypothetical protein